MSTGSSPSRLLSESLGNFHISSPTKFKSYVENDQFEGSNFNSQTKDTTSGKNYVRKLGNWSVNYGTVQQHGTDAENAEPPQWKQYMDEQAAHQDLHDKDRDALDPRSNLVVTSSLSDISLIPTNTFKHRAPKPANVDSNMDSEYSVVRDGDSAVDTDVDPAREALGVFNNVLRHQKSNFFSQEPENMNAKSISEEYDSTSSAASTSSYDSFDPSLSPSLRQRPSEPPKAMSKGPSRPLQQAGSPRRTLKLITPEDAGMIFNYKEGVWDQPSNAADMSTSGAQDESSQSKIVSFKLPRTRPERSIVDDTPLSTPQVDRKFLSQGDFIEESQSRSTSDKSTSTMRHISPMPADTTHNLVDNVTSVSEVDSSFRIAKSAVISALVDTIPRKEAWEHVTELSLKNRGLGSLVGLKEMTPGLVELNVSENNINSLQGAPPRIVRLCCSNNRIGSYCRLDGLEHLEDLDMSHNLLSTNLSLLAGCLHLRDVNLAQNSIVSLQGLSESRARVETLNLARNRLIGPLDFAEFVSLERDRPNFLTHLRELDLSGNKITRIKNLHLLKNLRVLKLDGNPLESLTGNNSSSLRNLGLLGCSALESLGHFPQLRILRVSGESLQIKELPETLEHFELVNSPPEAIPWDILPTVLRKLRLTRVGIQELPKQLATRCAGLHTLSIAENDLKSWARLIERLPGNLQMLDIRKNPLSQFQEEADRRSMTEVVALALPSLKRICL
ncbi:LADA_0A08900g1_1 [Lachancea dasiensis]|uniref:LADA_0A08900g1_1 n=1 Tax=Lachancea dasiensis TaxID=1072105 RepID=A0A1G4IQG2_9SACH|nr:LADA_0A08900g1_1 [Lachancea dasiensis]